jgi:predicted tellurium resistance membrane protein TerC
MSIPPDRRSFGQKQVAAITFGSAIFQIILLDMVFLDRFHSDRSRMTDNLAVMVIAVLSPCSHGPGCEPLANFIARNPTVVMLALGFLLMIGAVLIADGSAYTCRKAIYMRPWLSPCW